MRKPKDSLEEYTWLCHNLFGAYMDAIWGFHLVKNDAIDALGKSKNGKPPFMSFKPKKFDPNSPKTVSNEEMQNRSLNSARADLIIKRNETDGLHSNIIAGSIISIIYNYWEDKYRKQISEEFGLADKDSLKSNAIGDIRNIRNSIVHNKGYAKKNVESAKVFNWFKEGDLIILNYDKMMEIKNYLMNDFYSDCLKESKIEIK